MCIPAEKHLHAQGQGTFRTDAELFHCKKKSMQTNISLSPDSFREQPGSGTSIDTSESSDEEEIRRILAKCQKTTQQIFVLTATLGPSACHFII